MDYMAQLEHLLLIAGASILAGFFGLERESADKPAGFRTHMIIGGAAALLTILAQVMVAHFAESGLSDAIRVDPIRVIEAIVVGISFIGAGTILKMRGEVHFLTTAASILFTAGIGIAFALHQFVTAVGATLLIVIVTRFLGMLEVRFKNRHTDSGSREG
ncbi:MAG: MgtC/SapB family protein [Verrucomicrobiales bacterium]|nr:MgtC/SapB family protein [Verrucomicrobiales bacterium]